MCLVAVTYYQDKQWWLGTLILPTYVVHEILLLNPQLKIWSGHTIVIMVRIYFAFQYKFVLETETPQKTNVNDDDDDDDDCDSNNNNNIQ